MHISFLRFHIIQTTQCNNDQPIHFTIHMNPYFIIMMDRAEDSQIESDPPQSINYIGVCYYFPKLTWVGLMSCSFTSIARLLRLKDIQLQVDYVPWFHIESVDIDSIGVAQYGLYSMSSFISFISFIFMYIKPQHHSQKHPYTIPITFINVSYQRTWVSKVKT